MMRNYVGISSSEEEDLNSSILRGVEKKRVRKLLATGIGRAECMFL